MSGSPSGGGLAVASDGLTKRFASGQVAVDGVGLAVPTGSVYGFLGPNGSGKTTTIRLLLGLARPTSGSHTVLGVSMPDGAASVLPRVGALVDGPAFHPYLSGRANLARLDAADATSDPRTAATRIGGALDRVGLGAAASKRYCAYSLGMRQRLALAATLLRPRDLLVLDEPTNGLDPQGTREVRSLIEHLAADGMTVMLSTHLLSEVEQVCTHVGVMSTGRLVAQGSLEELRAGRAGVGRGVVGAAAAGALGARVRVRTPRPREAADTLRRCGLADVRVEVADEPLADGAAHAALGERAPESLVAALVADGVPVRGFAVERATLEDVFVALTGEGFDVDG